MKRIVSMVLAALMLFLLLSFSACGKDKKTHEEILNEISEFNRKKNEKRQTFLSSDAYSTAYDYVIGTLNELIPDCEAEISLEPGGLLGNDLSEFADFSENAETRQAFFSEAQLYISVNYWEFGVDPLELCDQLISRQLSGALAVDQYGEDTYQFDAASGEVSLYIMPGV